MKIAFMLVLATVIATVTSCAQLAEFEDKATEEAARGITDACDNPSQTASSYIDSVNGHLADRKGDTIAVTCAPR